MYFLTKKTITVENGEYTVYGMMYNDELRVDDISTDVQKVRTLVDSCNSHSLDPIHMFDVVEDFIAE